jgi:hypothetical protein
MAALHVDLQEGFERDRVVVSVNGAEVASRPEVTTRNQIGLADAIQIDVPEGAARVTVQVPTRGLADSVDVDVAGETYVGVSIEDHRLRLRQQRQAFGYL